MKDFGNDLTVWYLKKSFYYDPCNSFASNLTNKIPPDKGYLGIKLDIYIVITIAGSMLLLAGYNPPRLAL